MNDRIVRLRQASFEAVPEISPERARLMTQFYQAHAGKYSPAVLRARSYLHLCEHKTIWIGADELIVGERGPRPKSVPTYPELTCHSREDLCILDTRPKTRYAVAPETREVYETAIIPYWRGRSLRDRLFALLPDEWRAAYDAGIFTEFMEQRAPGHTVLDDKIYRHGLLEVKAHIAAARQAIDELADDEAYEKREELSAMAIACDATMLFARRHAELARTMEAAETDPRRRGELDAIASVCERVPAQVPRTFHEALQAYWFCHLAVITELNGWDSFSPGRLDQHLLPFYRRGVADGTLTEESARELLAAFFIKFNNHPAPPKVGVTAAESGTYSDFAAINIGGLQPDGADGANEVSHLILDTVDELHLLQPSPNLQLSSATPDGLLHHALRVVRKGYGYPSIFNADAVVKEQLRQGKSIEDARSGGTSGCVETGAFGKEAYVLTGYFNLVKVLELALHDGLDPRSGRTLGPRTGAAEAWTGFEDLYAAFRRQLEHFLEIKLRGNRLVQRLYAREMPAPFLSVLTDDCIARGCDYNAGGARYNNTYVQFVGIGSLTDSLAALKRLVCEERSLSMSELRAAMAADFGGAEPLRQRLLQRAPKYGNDDDAADALAVRVFDDLVALLDGRPDARGGCYRVEMLPTTSHIYFGSVVGAMPDGRQAGQPLSEGISPVQGADRRGPTAVMRSAAKMDHLKTGGTLLNMKFTPSVLSGDRGIERLGQLVRGYFGMNAHHVQFNVVTAETLRKAQARPEAYRDLIVRVAGYSDYFCDLPRDLQDEILLRTEQGAIG